MKRTEEREDRIYHISEILTTVLVDLFNNYYSNIPSYERLKDLSANSARFN